MKNITIFLLIAFLTACNEKSTESNSNHYSLFQGANGTIYLLDETSGKTTITFSPESPKLTVGTVYETENGKKFEYQGEGKLVEKVSAKERLEKLMKEEGQK